MKYKLKENIKKPRIRIRLNLIAFLVIGLVSLINVVSLNAQEHRNLAKMKGFCLKHLELSILWRRKLSVTRLKEN